MVRRIPVVAVALLVVGGLLAPTQTVTYVKGAVSGGAHTAQTIVKDLTR